MGGLPSAEEILALDFIPSLSIKGLCFSPIPCDLRLHVLAFFLTQAEFALVILYLMAFVFSGLEVGLGGVDEVGVLLAAVSQVLREGVAGFEVLDAALGHVVQGVVAPPVNRLVLLHVSRQAHSRLVVKGIQMLHLLCLFLLLLYRLLLVSIHLRMRLACFRLALFVHVEFVVDFLLGFLESIYIFLVLDPHQGFFEPAPVVFNLPLPLKVIFISTRTSSGLVAKVLTLTGMEDDILIADDVLPGLVLLGNGLEDVPIFKDVFDADLAKELSIKVAFNDEASDFSFLQRLLEDVFLYRVYGDQPVDVHSLCLPNSMAPVLRLFVHRWVPIRVVKDYAVSSCQIYPDSTTPG